MSTQFVGGIIPIHVIARDVYGTLKFFPANDEAKILAEIAGTKTLTRATLEAATRLGLSVEEIHIKTLATGSTK